eukprot:1161975-Pelagomonas_calceolata.AAC.3
MVPGHHDHGSKHSCMIMRVLKSETTTLVATYRDHGPQFYNSVIRVTCTNSGHPCLQCLQPALSSYLQSVEGASPRDMNGPNWGVLASMRTQMASMTKRSQGDTI